MIKQSAPSNDYIDSYYRDTLRSSQSYPRVTENLSVETCVIGGGFAGLMTALGLIERGHSNVAIVESKRIAWGASGRNGGFVFGGYSLGPGALVKQTGLDNARALYQMTTAAVDLIRKRISDFKIDCDLVDEGVIWANWFKDQNLLLKEQAFMKESLGVDWQYLSPQALHDKVKSQRYSGGLYEPNAMHFHPLNYAQGIAAQIVKAGGQVFEDTQVLDVQYKGAVKSVITSQGCIECKNIVLAGGGYLNKLCSPVARSVLPVATYVMTTEPLGEQLKQLMATKAAVYDSRFAFDYYRPLNDGRLLWGGRISANTKKPENLSELLRADMLKVFPELVDAKIERVWDGWMGYSRHQMAQVGQLHPGVWYNCGFGGHGVAPTTAAGEIVASAIADNNQDYQLFKPWGLPWNGGPFGPMAAQSSYWWYQMKDWLKERLE